jgi:hypothetical protein
VHPIEHLRYVARASHPDPVVLAQEAAFALVALANDPNGLLVGCRLVIEYHPENKPLWWVCARAVTSLEPRRTLRECMETLHEYAEDEPYGAFRDGREDEHVDVGLLAPAPWDVAFGELQRQYPEAIHLLKNAHTI